MQQKTVDLYPQNREQNDPKALSRRSKNHFETPFLPFEIAIEPL
jgi:hypothetical protein